MANNDYGYHNIIRPSTQKILFAEDLVNFILRRYSFPDVVFSTERQRKNCVSIFDENLKMAANFLLDTVGFMTEQAYHFMMNNNLNNSTFFECYAFTIKAKFFGTASYTESFFQYSVHLAHLAVKLYTQEFQEALIIAVQFIKESMILYLFKSGKVILDLVAQKYAENQFILFNEFECTSQYKEDESFKQAPDVVMCVTQEDLCQCKVTENIYGEEHAEKKGSKSGEYQRHVDINRLFEKMNEDSTTISSFSSINQSQVDSGFEKIRAFVHDPRSSDSYNVSLLDYIGVPGLLPYGEPTTNLYSREYYPADSSEYEIQRKKPRLDLDI